MQNTATIQKTLVRFDRSLCRWLATVQDAVKEFPPGADGKRQAQLTALAAEYPQLHDIVADIASQNDHNTSVVQRLIKAAFIIIDNRIFSDGTVQSQADDDTWYRVSYSGVPKSYSCDCIDHERGLAVEAGLATHGAPNVAGLGVMCKHCLASHMIWLSRTELPERPIPFGQKPTYLCQECGLEPGYCICSNGSW